MPQISVRFFAAAREAFGTKEQPMTGRTLGDVIGALTEEASPEAVTVVSRSSFLVNSLAVTDHDHSLSDGDTVDVLPPFAGG